MHPPWSKNTLDLQPSTQAQRDAWSHLGWQSFERTWQGSSVYKIYWRLKEGLHEEARYSQSPQETLILKNIFLLFFFFLQVIYGPSGISAFVSCQVRVVIEIKGTFLCAVKPPLSLIFLQTKFVEFSISVRVFWFWLFRPRNQFVWFPCKSMWENTECLAALSVIGGSVAYSRTWNCYTWTDFHYSLDENSQNIVVLLGEVSDFDRWKVTTPTDQCAFSYYLWCSESGDWKSAHMHSLISRGKGGLCML